MTVSVLAHLCVTPGKINIAGRPAGVTLDWSLSSVIVACGGQYAGRFWASPMCRFGPPENHYFLLQRVPSLVG